MLIIRQAQVHIFRERAYETWAARVFDDVIACWPRLARLPDAAVHARLVRAARAADGLGLVSGGAWLRYANVALALGDDFAEQPEAAGILSGPLPAPVKLERLVANVSEILRGR